MGPIHDVLLMYSRSESYTWISQFTPEAAESVEKWYVHEDGRGRYKRGDLTGAGTRAGASGEPWRGFNPTGKGRHWAVPREILARVASSSERLSPQASLDLLFDDGRIIWPQKKGGQPMLKRYFHEAKGVPAGDVITDIPPLSLSTTERLGYPTQKPVALLERIVAASSKEGDVVLDPFCGCGTTIDAAQRLKREWIGIDITYLAVGLIKSRLLDSFGAKPKVDYGVIGEPTDLSGARQLALDDRHQFEHWALGLVAARASAHGKGADKGVDGVLLFQEGGVGSPHRRVIISVKSGHLTAPMVRELPGILDREKASIGLLIALEAPSGPMRREAASAGFYESPWGRHPRVQILTIEDLLEGKGIDMPPIRPGGTTFKKAAKVRRNQGEQLTLDEKK